MIEKKFNWCPKEPCLVEKKINYELKRLVGIFETVTKMAKDNWLGNIDSLRNCCTEIIFARREIATLALILHPEFRYVEIDAQSFKGFMEGKEDLIRIIFFNCSGEDKVYRYFKPEEMK